MPTESSKETMHCFSTSSNQAVGSVYPQLGWPHGHDDYSDEDLILICSPQWQTTV